MRISRHFTQEIARAVIWAASFFTLAVMFWILYQVLREGLPLLHLSFFVESPREMGRAGGISSTIVGTLALTVVAIVIATQRGFLPRLRFPASGG